MIRPFHFYLANVKFKQNNQSKVRPVLIITIDGPNTFSAYRITSQFKNKSKYYQHYYYRIKQLKIAGLNEKSYIDTSSYDVLNKSQIINKRPIGILSDEDLDSLLEFLRTR